MLMTSYNLRLSSIVLTVYKFSARCASWVQHFQRVPTRYDHPSSVMAHYVTELFIRPATLTLDLLNLYSGFAVNVHSFRIPKANFMCHFVIHQTPRREQSAEYLESLVVDLDMNTLNSTWEVTGYAYLQCLNIVCNHCNKKSGYMYTGFTIDCICMCICTCTWIAHADVSFCSCFFPLFLVY